MKRKSRKFNPITKVTRAVDRFFSRRGAGPAVAPYIISYDYNKRLRRKRRKSRKD